MVRLIDLFWSFFKVGSFTIGGGYAMIPLMQREVVDRHAWLTDEEFLDYVSLSQTMPGVFAVNMAAMLGQRLRGAAGATACIVGCVMMPIVFILLLAMVFRTYGDNPTVAAIFRGLRPCVVALIAAPVFRMAQSARVSWRNVWIPIASALAVWLLGVNPIWVVLAAVGLGFLFHKLGLHL